MASNDGVEQLPQLSAAPTGSPGSSIDEKAEIRGLQKRHSSDSSLDHKEKLDEKEDPYAHDSEVVYVRGEPVISNGRDVSRFLIDTRDDGDPAITFRSLFIGTVFAGLGAALCQVRVRPPELGFAFNGAIFRLNLVVDAIFVRFRSTCSSRSKCRSPRCSFSS